MMNSPELLRLVIQAQTDMLSTTLNDQIYKLIVETCEGISGSPNGAFFTPVVVDGEHCYERKYPLQLEGLPELFNAAHGGDELSEVLRTQRPTLVNAEDVDAYREYYKSQGVLHIGLIPVVYKQHSYGIVRLRFHHALSEAERERMMNNLLLFCTFSGSHLQNIALLKEKDTALKTRDTFIDFAAHELRTPLTAATTYAQIIKKNVADEKLVTEHTSRMLSEQLKHMKLLINQFLDANAMSEQLLSYEKQQLVVVDILRETNATFHTLYPKRKLQEDMFIAPTTMIYADKTKLFQVIMNLYTNAVKYSSPHATIYCLVQQHPGVIEIQIRDEGMGIKSEDLGKIFDIFYRTEQASSVGGVGIGLYLTKSIIEAHAGTIAVTSEIGKGSTFTIQLPRINPT